MSPSGAVFLSYASQDASAVRSIADALRAAGVEVWFDQSELVGGDAWDAKIRGQIKTCALFVPVISAATQARREGYFRLEWKLAAQRTHTIADGTPFLLPVVIDATKDGEALVPEEFRAVQWTRLPGGEQAEKFGERVKQLLGGSVVGGALRPDDGTKPGESGHKAPPTITHRSPWLAPAILGAAVVVALALWQPWREREKSAPATAPSPVAKTEASKSSLAQTLAVPVSDKSLVVLPLENFSPDPENALFTEGMHTEIISNLQLLSDLKVISRGRALAFKGSTASNAEIAQKLGVANVITGSVRREKNVVRITLELRRASDDALLWSLPKGNRDLKDALALQSDIAEQVARVLQAREFKGGPKGLAQFMTKNPQAYDLYLKARKAQEEGDGRNWEEIATQCEASLALDPNFMSAAGMLSNSRTALARNATNSAERVRLATEAKRWADAATQMVPGGGGDGALSFYYAWVEREGVRSLVLAENTIRARPNSANAHHLIGIILANLGRCTEAVAADRHAIELDPLVPNFEVRLAGYLAALRRPDESRQALANAVAKGGAANSQRIIETRYVLSGEIPAALDGLPAGERAIWLWRGRRFAEAQALTGAELRNDKIDDVQRWTLLCAQADVCARLGQTAEAAAVREALAAAERLQSVPEVGPTQKPGWLAAAWVRNGRNDDAIVAAKRAVEAASPVSQVSLRWEREIALAKIYAYAKRPRECVELLAKLLRVPSGITVPMLKIEPDWDNVRDDAAFKALLADPKNSAPL